MGPHRKWATKKGNWGSLYHTQFPSSGKDSPLPQRQIWISKLKGIVTQLKTKILKLTLKENCLTFLAKVKTKIIYFYLLFIRWNRIWKVSDYSKKNWVLWSLFSSKITLCLALLSYNNLCHLLTLTLLRIKPQLLFSHLALQIRAKKVLSCWEFSYQDELWHFTAWREDTFKISCQDLIKIVSRETEKQDCFIFQVYTIICMLTLERS